MMRYVSILPHTTVRVTAEHVVMDNNGSQYGPRIEGHVMSNPTPPPGPHSTNGRSA